MLGIVLDLCQPVLLGELRPDWRHPLPLQAILYTVPVGLWLTGVGVGWSRNYSPCAMLRLP